MEYTTIYDIADTGLSANWWWILTFTFGFAAVLLTLIVIPRFRQTYGLPAYIGLFIVSTVGLNFLMSSHFSHRRIFSEIAAGRLHTAEGTIENFRPDKGGRGEAHIERFTIGGIEFAYSSDSPGFKQTQVYGGPLEEGLNTRITYVELDADKVITKVDLERK